MRAVLFFLLSFAVTRQTVDFSLLAAFALVNGALFFIFDPTLKASLPLIIDVDKLEKANSVDSAVSSFSGLIGMFVGGMVLAFAGVESCFLVNSVTFAVSASCSFIIRIPRVSRREGRFTLGIVFSEMRGALEFVFRDRNLFYIMTLGLILTAFIMPAGSVLFPILLKTVIHFKALAFSVIQGGFPLGIILGVIACMKIKIEDGGVFFLVYACGIGMAAILLGWVAIAFLYPVNDRICALLLMVSVIGMGMLTVITMIKTMTYFQTITPKHLLGKVISFYQMIASSFVPIGYVAYGSLILYFKIKTVFVILSLLVILSTTAVLMVRRAKSNLIAADDRGTVDRQCRRDGSVS